MKIRIINILFFVLLAVYSSAQIDTVYLDENWNETNSAHKYFRIIEECNSIYSVEDYFKSGNIQMRGTFLSIEPQVKHGYFVWFNESGDSISSGYFDNDKKNGVWAKYENGKIDYFETYNSDSLCGLSINWNDRNEILDITVYPITMRNIDLSYFYKFIIENLMHETFDRLVSVKYLETNYNLNCISYHRLSRVRALQYTNVNSSIDNEVVFYRSGKIRFWAKSTAQSDTIEYLRRNGSIESLEVSNNTDTTLTLYHRNNKTKLIKETIGRYKTINWYYKNGNLKMQQKFVDGLLTEPYFKWDKNGTKYKVEYINIDKERKFLGLTIYYGRSKKKKEKISNTS